MSKFKNKINFILVLFVFILNFGKVFGVVELTRNFYINDYANILSHETKDYILNNSQILDKKTSAQVVVVTVKSLENKNLNDYALELFRKSGIGDKKLNNGLLILLTMHEREIRVEVGPGLGGRINDAKVGRFLDEYGIPYFKNNDWDTGVKTLYSALISEVYAEYEIEMPDEVANAFSSYTPSENDVGIILPIVIFGLIVAFGGIVPFIITLFRRPKSLFTTTYYYDDDDDDHRRGGGNFFGGGGFFGSGGGFSGGGGSSDGGGASRGF